MASRFVVGIDLGTTNSALAYVDTGAGKDAKVAVFPIPQVVAPGAVEDRPLLPSFLYLPGAERAAGRQPEAAVGRRSAITASASSPATSARQVPTRLVASAKSWLCHPGVDRTAADPAVEGAGDAAARSRRSKRPRATSSTWPRRGTTRIAKDVAEHRLEAAGHRPDRAGVVRRRGPRTDRRGRPRRRARAPHAARRAAGRVLRLDRRAAGDDWREAGRASATWSWSATSAAAPPTSR